MLWHRKIFGLGFSYGRSTLQRSGGKLVNFSFAVNVYFDTEAATGGIR